jgi:catechol 2,3-dioxygenase-like lactoylglutathione lyase family enzyme
MISHVSIGVADIERSKRFYDAVLGALGCKRLFDSDIYGVAYGVETPEFWVGQSEAPPGPQPGSGLHICFDAPDRAAVDAFHAAALAHGGADNGKPGLRPEYHANYYAAFAVDPDGWRIEAYFGR